MKPKRTMRSFPFIFNEWKWTQWTKCSFSMNGNERSKRNIHFQWIEMNARTKRSFNMNGNESREQTVQLQKELLNVLFIFYIHFRVFCHFWTTFDPKKAFFGHFWGFLRPNLTKMNKTFFLQNKNERRERNLHFHWTEINVENAENETFIFTERKWT